MCCYFSEESACMVIAGMKTLAKTRNEAPFAILSRGITEESIDIKSAIAQFVNNLVMGLETTQARTILRAELDAQMYLEKYTQILEQIEYDIGLESDSASTAASSPVVTNLDSSLDKDNETTTDVRESRKLVKPTDIATNRHSWGKASSTNESTVDSEPLGFNANASTRSLLDVESVSGLKRSASMRQRLQLQQQRPSSVASTSFRNSVSSNSGFGLGHAHSSSAGFSAVSMTVGHGINATTVCPSMGTMAGILLAAKNQDRGKIVDLFGGKKTKHRW